MVNWSCTILNALWLLPILVQLYSKIDISFKINLTVISFRCSSFQLDKTFIEENINKRSSKKNLMDVTVPNTNIPLG